MPICRIVRHRHYQASDSTALPSNRMLCLAADLTNPAFLGWVPKKGVTVTDRRG